MNKTIISITAIFISLLFALPLQAQESKAIELLKPNLERGTSLMQSLHMRKTSREFNDKELSLDLLSNLLWAATGINRPEERKRTAPTAVNWQEIETYVAIKQGLFKYNITEHRLDPVLPEDIRSDIGKQGFTKDAALGLIYVSDYDKMKGGAANKETKPFYSATDTGFVSQNVYLFCASEGLATVVMGWVDKEQLHKKMKLGKNQHIVLTQAVGYPKE